MKRSKHATPAVESDWLESGLARLAAIAEFPAGWDSHGAVSPRRDLVAAAQRIATALCAKHALPRPWINATPSGGVQFEWEMGPRSFELEIMEPDRAEFLYADHDARIEEEGAVTSRDTLDQVAEYVRRATSV